jgi:O-antigen ligase
VALMLLWSVHDGGYDDETWYWGALATLALLAGCVATPAVGLRPSRARLTVIALFAGYVAWCYLSMAWAQSPGDALQGANQALLYLLIFSLMILLPWTPEAALAALVAFVAGVGAIAVVLLFDLASGYHLAELVIEGRLAAPTGYFNATAALFTIEALAATALATRRSLPGPLRGLMLAFACAGLQLALIVQSRGWLFTLPLVGLVAIIVVGDRLRVVAAAVLPVAGTLVVIHRLLHVYQTSAGTALGPAATQAGRPALALCAAVFFFGTLAAWADTLWPAPALAPARRRIVGATLSALLAIGLVATGVELTHGHPVRFISRQWNGFSHEQTSFSSSSHFADVGSGRYDFWRVALDAFLAHPVGGLGEDNFADYYVVHRRTDEEPSWTHSLEMRLLAQTGLVGFALFTAFLVAAVALADRARRRAGPLQRTVAGIALLPLVVWLIHGSLDWFWEIPALSGPALGFLAVAGSLATDPAPATGRAAVRGRRRAFRATARAARIAGGAALVAGAIVLGLPYLSAREVSLGSDAGVAHPAAALSDLATAAALDPFNSSPGRVAGTIALTVGENRIAEQRFAQSIAREPGGWFAWLGAGLAASALSHRATARADFDAARAINARQPAIAVALQRVDSADPLTSAQAFKLLILAQ